MKISYRILVINFSIVALILFSSAFVFYSIVYNVLTAQQSKYLLNSANNFLYSYRGLLQQSEDDFIFLNSEVKNNGYSELDISNKKIDFIITTTPDGKILERVTKDPVNFTDAVFSIGNFLDKNPTAIVKQFTKYDVIHYYGKIISSDDLNQLSARVGADIAIIWDDSPIEFSNESVNRKYTHALNSAYRSLKPKSNFDTELQESADGDILCTLFKPSTGNEESRINFVIYSPLSEAADLKTNLKYFFIIVGFAGITLSLILTLVFTDKIRKQITRLSKATEITGEGNFKNKIPIRGNDEIAQLAGAFNSMLDVLEKNERAKNEYSEFITLINQNPTLSEISNASLRKIISACGFTIGALYIVEGDKYITTSSYGIPPSEGKPESNNFISQVLKTGEKVEIDFNENAPVVSAGSLTISIKHLLLLPVFYNNKIIAVLELGSIDKISEEVKDYLYKIQKQLAIGLTNAIGLVQLERIVAELKSLNEDYQKQNIQIRKQNETLVELHLRLKEKADELEVQRTKAEESTKLKSEFLASMSHELRTPMNSILGLSELILEESSLKGKNRERLEVVLKSGKRLMTLINDILDLSKIEAGKMELHHEDIYLEELIKDVETSISPLIYRKPIELVIERLTNTNIVHNTDRGKVTQVLINLLGNSVKFTEKGLVTLSVSSKDENLIFEVRDTGIGISEENQKLIFDEFRQVDGTTTRKYSGTGLGLAICKKIANMLEGSITVKSKVGEGSVFTFTIPLNFVSVREEAAAGDVAANELVKNSKHPVLVIDDDSEVRYTIGQYLNSKGYEVVFAESGAKGLKAAQEVRPFAITLDIKLPDMDGWDVLKNLKENPVTRDIPVILISILGEQNIGYGLGAFEYFVKPVSHESLLSAFSKLENVAKKKIEKIVIVDDDELEFIRFSKEFKNENLRIEYIKESEFAYNKILEVQPDLIILDLIMPKVDGISLSYKLKSSRETRHIPIIISTAKDLTEAEKESLKNIVDDITVKSRGHSLDVLKVVRDRINMKEIYSYPKEIGNKKPEAQEIEQEEPEYTPGDDQMNHHYLGEVLIVDDDPDTLFTINEIVQKCNCKTLLAKNGIECLHILETANPDLILLDIMMPEMDGFQTINRIKQDIRLAHIPVYAVTAKAMADDKEVILKHGFDDYVPKPVNAGMLAFKIEKVFSKIKLS